jgi:hypothetical protein
MFSWRSASVGELGLSALHARRGCGIVLQYDATSPFKTTQLRTVECPEYLDRLALAENDSEHSDIKGSPLDSGVYWLRYPGLVNFDISVQKDIFVIEERARIQLPADAFNVFNHANFTGMNTTLNFNAYPTTPNGIVDGSPTIVSTVLGRNANGSFNVTGFGTVASPAAGAARECFN